MIHFPSGMSVPVFSQHADWRFLSVWMCCFCRLSDPAFFKFIPSTQQSPVNFREGRKLWSITILKKKEAPEKDGGPHHRGSVCNATGKCVQKDDMAEILQKMIKADVIVLASPVYFYGMNGEMKTFIDRTVPQYTKISDKDFYFIITAADTIQKHMDKVIEGFRGFTADCLENAHEKGIVYGLGAWQKGEIEHNHEAMLQAYEFGKNA